jgi:hypothetical protein
MQLTPALVQKTHNVKEPPVPETQNGSGRNVDTANNTHGDSVPSILFDGTGKERYFFYVLANQV